jgi:glycosyltransferase involved in cell wall biosynthesis
MEILKVVFLSEWLANPYKKLLAEHLKPEGVEAEEYRWKMIFAPMVIQSIGLWSPGILHLHTLHPFLQGKTKLSRFVKFCVFVTQIFILKLINIKTVWTVHEWSDKVGSGKQDIPLIYTKILGHFIDAFITHCKSTKHEIVKAFDIQENSDKALIIPHGNYIASYVNKIDRIEARYTLKIPNENVTFLLFGSIYRYKGFLEAIELFKKLDRRDVTLIVAGQPKEDQLQDLIEDKIKDHQNILFISDRVPDEDVQLYMNASDCVLVPYRVFTTSGVAILAMSFGRTCIAPRIGFFEDMLDASGSFLYDSMQENDLLYAMKLAVDKKHELPRMGEYNFQVAQQWNWNFVAKETFKLYQWCLKF